MSTQPLEQAIATTRPVLANVGRLAAFLGRTV